MIVVSCRWSKSETRLKREDSRSRLPIAAFLAWCHPSLLL